MDIIFQFSKEATSILSKMMTPTILLENATKRVNFAWDWERTFMNAAMDSSVRDFHLKSARNRKVIYIFDPNSLNINSFFMNIYNAVSVLIYLIAKFRCHKFLFFNSILLRIKIPAGPTDPEICKSTNNRCTGFWLRKCPITCGSK